jgi:hypothetical protein
MSKRRAPPMDVQPSYESWHWQAIPMAPVSKKKSSGKAHTSQPAISQSMAEIARKGSLTKQRKLLEAVRTRRSTRK